MPYAPASMTHTTPPEAPWDDTDGDGPGNWNIVEDTEDGEVANLPAVKS